MARRRRRRSPGFGKLGNSIKLDKETSKYVPLYGAWLIDIALFFWLAPPIIASKLA